MATVVALLIIVALADCVLRFYVRLGRALANHFRQRYQIVRRER